MSQQPIQRTGKMKEQPLHQTCDCCGGPINPGYTTCLRCEKIEDGLLDGGYDR